MEYQLDINGSTILADVAPGRKNRAKVALGEKAYTLEYHRISDTRIQLRVNGRQINAWVTPAAGGKTIILNGRHFFVGDHNAQDTGKPKPSGDGEVPAVVTPPMPAIVIQMPVSEGDRVVQGDTVAVVSAMKMETSLKAPHTGIVTCISAAEGDKVMPGDILVDIEKETEGESA